MAPKMIGPRPMTRAEQDAFTLHIQRIPLADIEERTTLRRPRIAAAVDLAQVHAQLASQPPVPVAEPPRPTASTRRPAAPHDLVEKNRALTATVRGLREQLRACEAEIAELRAALQPAPAAHVVAEDIPAPREDLAESDEVREWARSDGWVVPAEGRLPGGIVAAYKARGGAL